MPSTATPLLGLIDQANGENDQTWGNNADTNYRILEATLAGYTTVTVTDGATATAVPFTDFTQTAHHNAVFKLTGTLTAARSVEFAKKSRQLTVWNATTGGFAVTVKTTGGSGVSIPAGKKAILFCDGTDIVSVVVDPASSTSGTTTVAAENVTGTLTLAQLPVAADGESSATKVLRSDDSRLTPAGTIPDHSHTLSDITDAGTAAAANTGIAAGNVVVLNGSAALPAVSGANLTGVVPADASVTIAKLATGVIATQEQSEAGTSSTTLVTPLGVKQAIAAQVGTSTTVEDGAITFPKMATTAVATTGEAAAGTSNVKLTTPAGVAAAIAALAPSGELADGSVTYVKLNSALIASQANAVAGTSNTVLMTPLRAYQEWQQTAQVALPSAPGTFSASTAHGFATAPRVWAAKLVCTVADVGYSAGDTVLADATTGVGGNGRGLVTRVNATHFRTIAGSGGNYQLLNAVTGDPEAMTPGSWRLVYVYHA